MTGFLHEAKDFHQLLALVSDQRRLDPVLVEKDYWIMHCLWGLQAQGLNIELKGGTSLSKGFGIIHRFSEDIDIRIDPPAEMQVKTGRNQDKQAHIASRRQFYDWLANRIRIPGIVDVQRDVAFDDEKMRSAGIRLQYIPHSRPLQGVKDGILLELGFDDTAPNRPVTISSWVWDAARKMGVRMVDNRAINVRCYAPTHTFVEKLQAVSTKYRRLDAGVSLPANFLRHYYDIYCLLGLEEVRAFLLDPAYQIRKALRFRPGDEQIIARNPAFILANADERKRFAAAYRKTSALYYQGQPDFDTLLARIHQYITRM